MTPNQSATVRLTRAGFAVRSRSTFGSKKQGPEMDRTWTRSGNVEHIVVLLCGAMFVLSGIWAGSMFGSDVVFWLRMRNPVQATGHLTMVEEIGNGVARGTSVKYQYTFQNRTYIGRRATIHQTPDNFGDFQWKLMHNLSEAYNNGEEVTVYLNPKHPELSALDLTVRLDCVAFPAIYCALALPCGFFLLIPGPNRKRKPNRTSEDIVANRAESSR